MKNILRQQLRVPFWLDICSALCFGFVASLPRGAHSPGGAPSGLTYHPKPGL